MDESGNVVNFPVDESLEATAAAAEAGEEPVIGASATFIKSEPLIYIDIPSQFLTLETARELAVSLADALKAASSG